MQQAVVLSGTKKQSRICSCENETLNCWHAVSLRLSKCSCAIQTWKTGVIYESAVLVLIDHSSHCISLPALIALYFREGGGVHWPQTLLWIAWLSLTSSLGSTRCSHPHLKYSFGLLSSLVFECSLHLNGESCRTLRKKKLRNLNWTQKHQTLNVLDYFCTCKTSGCSSLCEVLLVPCSPSLGGTAGDGVITPARTIQISNVKQVLV